MDMCNRSLRTLERTVSVGNKGLTPRTTGSSVTGRVADGFGRRPPIDVRVVDGAGRDPAKVEHDLTTILRQRLFALLAGYQGANAYGRLLQLLGPMVEGLKDAFPEARIILCADGRNLTPIPECARDGEGIQVRHEGEEQLSAIPSPLQALRQSHRCAYRPAHKDNGGAE